MKKANFMKFGKQFLAAVFSIVLLGGIMLNTQTAEAQRLSLTDSGDGCDHGSKTWRTEWSDEHNSTVCYNGGDCCCAQGN